jgi:hypothetical protein
MIIVKHNGVGFIDSALRPSCLPHQLRQLGDIRRNPPHPTKQIVNPTQETKPKSKGDADVYPNICGNR